VPTDSVDLHEGVVTKTGRLSQKVKQKRTARMIRELRDIGYGSTQATSHPLTKLEAGDRSLQKVMLTTGICHGTFTAYVYYGIERTDEASSDTRARSYRPKNAERLSSSSMLLLDKQEDAGR